jgi:hypothetical protein
VPKYTYFLVIYRLATNVGGENDEDMILTHAHVFSQVSSAYVILKAKDGALEMCLVFVFIS